MAVLSVGARLGTTLVSASLLNVFSFVVNIPRTRKMISKKYCDVISDPAHGKT